MPASLFERATWERALLPSERVDSPPVPLWLDEIALAFAGAVPPEPPPWPATAASGLLEAVRPLVERARARLRAGLAARHRPSAPWAPDEAERLLSAGLSGPLFTLAGRTLVLELHACRLQGSLAGATSAERFASFVARMSQRDAALALLAEYPVLARATAETLARWVEVSLELFGRLAEDWPALTATLFAGRGPGPLAGLETGAGDAHRGGRSVAILTFASGARLVYKPRSLAVDLLFSELAACLGEDLPLPRLPLGLDRGAWGWAEHVAPAPCRDLEEVRLFHRRLGGLLALLHALDATDCHFENVIAAGAHPVPVDLETLFHPRSPQPPPERPDARLTAGLFSRSVLRVGLLPFRTGEAEEPDAPDHSGVAAVEGQPTPPVLQWEGAGTDAMRAVRVRLPMPGGSNRPRLDGREAAAEDFAAEVAEGFAAVYRRLAERRAALLAPGGPLARAAGCEVRAVLRATRAYGLLLADSCHPDLLRDAADRDRFLDRLEAGIAERPALARILPAERRDLARGDVPLFTARPGSADLWTGDGERLAGFFAEPPLDAVRRKLADLGEEDLERQRGLIRLSLATSRLRRGAVGRPRYDFAEPLSTPAPAELRARLRAAARSVAERLARLAVREADEATWITVDARAQRWALIAAPEDLYAGLPGIALGLGYLGEALGEERFTALARAAVRTLLGRLAHTAGEVRTVGAFHGWGGILYTLAHLGTLWGDAALLAQGERAMDRIDALAGEDEDLDVVGGLAGAVAALLAAHAATGSRRAQEIAVRCGDLLLSRARPAETGLAWSGRLGGGRPQTGFSHGAAGIGWALCELAAAAGEERFAAAGRAAFACEREVFWPELERWRAGGGAAETGDPPLESAVAMAWCHGAPGVALARLRALRMGEDPELRRELAAALDLTTGSGFGQSHCLCHGDLGNLDLLLQACSPAAGDPLAGRLGRLVQGVLDGFDRRGPLCGTQGGVEAPGLMTGLAGIGLGLLRLAAPERVPSVLALEPPR